MTVFFVVTLAFFKPAGFIAAPQQRIAFAAVLPQLPHWYRVIALTTFLGMESRWGRVLWVLSHP